MNEFSYYRCPISNAEPERTVSIEEVFDMIKSVKMEQLIKEIRREEDPQKRQAKKCAELDYVTFSGVFGKRNMQDIESHSGLICMDYDHIGTMKDVARKKYELAKDKYLDIRLIFVSPSGDGMKAVVKIGPSRTGTAEELQAWHKQEYIRVATWIEAKYGLKCDKTSDMSRACFLSWDTTPYLRSDPEERGWKRLNKQEKIEYSLRQLEDSHRDVTKNYNDWVRIGFGLAHEFGEEGRQYYHRLSKNYSNYQEDETDEKYDECIKHNIGKVKIGTVLWLLWRYIK